MAIVYTHIKPLQKRTINFFKQRLHELGEDGQSGGIIGELLRHQGFFEEILKTYAASFVIDVEQATYIERLLTNVRKQLTEALIEKKLVKDILNNMHPCYSCKGSGKLWTTMGLDSSKHITCPSCSGQGVAKEAVA